MKRKEETEEERKKREMLSRAGSTGGLPEKPL